MTSRIKRLIFEALLILLISLIISLLYNAASTTGITLLKRAFKIRAATGNITIGTDLDRSRMIFKRYV